MADTPQNAYQAAITLVTEKFADVTGKASANLTTLLEWLEDLGTNIEDFNAVEPTITHDALGGLGTMPTRPDIQDIEANFPGDVSDHGNLDVDISSIAKPDMSGLVAPSVSIVAGDISYTSQLLTALRTKLYNDVDQGGTGLSDAVEDHIWNRQYERDLRAHQDASERISSDWSKRGFPLPNGVLAALLNDEDLTYTNKRLDTSRDIAIKQAELAQTNTHFAIQQGSALEAQLMNFANLCQTRLMEASKAQAMAEVELYSAHVQGYKIMVDLYNALISAKIDSAKAMVQIYAAEVEAYKARVSGEAERIRALADEMKAQASVYQSDADVYRSVSDVTIKAFEAKIRAAIAQADANLKAQELNMRAIESSNAIGMEAAKAQAQILAQVVAGMWSAVSAAAEIRGSGSTQTSTNYNITSEA